MFVSNLTNRILGLASPVVLRPNEVNRFIDDENTRLVESVWRAKAANLVSVSETSGMVKTIAATAVKTLTFDAGALSTEPRSSGKKAEEAEKVLQERLTNKEAKKVDAVEEAVKAEDVKDEAVQAEAVQAEAVHAEEDNNKNKKSSKKQDKVAKDA